jgi:hypothetical protein
LWHTAGQERFLKVERQSTVEDISAVLERMAMVDNEYHYMRPWSLLAVEHQGEESKAETRTIELGHVRETISRCLEYLHIR